MLSTSQDLVRRYHHNQWDVEHVFLALLELDEGIPVQVLERLEIPVENMKARLEEALVGIPRLAHDPTQLYATLGLPKLLRRPRQRPSVLRMSLSVPNIY